MTVPMPLIEDIRSLDRDGTSGREIARRLGVSRDTVAKYVAIDDFSPQVPVKACRTRRVMTDPVKQLIDQILELDRGCPRKQRHTAKRVFERVVAEKDYQGSYRTVSAYVKEWHEAHQSPSDGFGELVWGPGDAQIDFGQVHVINADGDDETHSMLVVSFPYSNARYGQLYRGETAECVCHGLQTIYDHIGFVPCLQVFDNATGIGRRVGQIVKESDLFARFRTHHGFHSRFCNPYSGNEKGHVENAVGYLRRNLCVPLPKIDDIHAFNKELLDRCDELLEQDHYRKKDKLSLLHRDDQQAGLPLPVHRFQPVRFDTRQADKDGRIKFENNYYLIGGAYAGRELTISIGAEDLRFFTPDGIQVGRLTRCFTHSATTIAAEQSLLDILVTRPGAFSHSPLRSLMPTALVSALDQASYNDKRHAIKALTATSTACGFDATMNAAEHLLERSQPLSQASLDLLASSAGSIYHPNPAVDLAIYDTLAAS